MSNVINSGALNPQRMCPSQGMTAYKNRIQVLLVSISDSAQFCMPDIPSRMDFHSRASQQLPVSEVTNTWIVAQTCMIDEVPSKTGL